ncbi:MAG: SDR family NAD(P)-dependent oxidoreductase [Xanthomonadales bacterium]|nr:SDR family NAD(P)-dependent oxidoreductase [Xanthomonadales bacterium]
MKTVLITGANRGLGLGFTRHYLKQGARVFASARDLTSIDAFEELSSTHGERFTAILLDAALESSIKEAASKLKGVRFDLVLNNAGVCPDEAFGTWKADTFATAFAVNATGPALISQAMAPLMNPGATLVNISSGLGSCGANLSPETGLDAYGASKTALNLITRRLATKLATKKITVVAISPGWVQTRMGGEQADLTVGESIAAVTATIEDLGLERSGSFLTRSGDSIPW